MAPHTARGTNGLDSGTAATMTTNWTSPRWCQACKQQRRLGTDLIRTRRVRHYPCLCVFLLPRCFPSRCCYFWSCLVWLSWRSPSSVLRKYPSVVLCFSAEYPWQASCVAARGGNFINNPSPTPLHEAAGLGAGHPSSTINAHAQITDAGCCLLTRSRQACPAWRGHHTTFRAGRPALPAPSPPSPIPRAPGPDPYKDCDPGTVTRNHRR